MVSTGASASALRHRGDRSLARRRFKASIEEESQLTMKRKRSTKAGTYHIPDRFKESFKE
jgi:hypothetical protein